ncbi:aminotransferase class V-fold PLP-dependent enzyme [Sulfitobacter sp. TSTF-M16]|uniref:Aminotransferase class V-fold PLP-dependent enzyme n=1 Tax=Sulfitobacter aestuariivivens TaxID=2766981 RepID=A0A927HDX6_9RHOB|nr:aminotransferase class V-fold PLP-dependent enzyme [Sulfitobacter aestuariivivens]MBD3662798.1 aminotransferase class V-fold PLP-dependent enzyme [Sulfitobacter aestuariivivens]
MTTETSLAHGRSYLAIPGPSVMPDEVLRAMHRAAPNIYSGALIDMMPGLLADVRRVARTKHHVAMYIGNGHAVWEASLANVVGPGDSVLVPSTGHFGTSWAGMAESLGVTAHVLDFGKRAPMDLERVADTLAADKAHEIKAVLAVHVDTSTSVRNDIAGLRQVLDAADHPALLMVDCIASMGCDAFEMDAWGVDVAMTACQKGLMVPPGVGFVFFNDRAAARRAEMARVSSYWDWTPRAHADSFWQYHCGTAPTQHMYGLRTALDMIHAEGIENVWHRHEVLAEAIWVACEAWGKTGPFELNIIERAHRSRAVTALRLQAPYATALREWTQSRIGLTLGIGLGMVASDDPNWHGFFRLGHMGHVNGQMIMGLLGGMQAGLRALDIPHGEGALDAAAEVIARG